MTKSDSSHILGYERFYPEDGSKNVSISGKNRNHQESVY